MLKRVFKESVAILVISAASSGVLAAATTGVSVTASSGVSVAASSNDDTCRLAWTNVDGKKVTSKWVVGDKNILLKEAAKLNEESKKELGKEINWVECQYPFPPLAPGQFIT